MPPVEILKGGVLGQPLKLHRTGLAMTVFCNDTFCNVMIFRRVVVIVVPVEEQDDIRVLLDGARFPQV